MNYIGICDLQSVSDKNRLFDRLEYFKDIQVDTENILELLGMLKSHGIYGRYKTIIKQTKLNTGRYRIRIH